MSMFGRKKVDLPSAVEALPGRDVEMPVPARHYVLGTPAGAALPGRRRDGRVRHGLLLGRRAQVLGGRGRVTTAVGYAAGTTPNPTYEEVCTGLPATTRSSSWSTTPPSLLRGAARVFWENHDPTQGMRQGNDVGTQYRSGI